MATLSRLRAHGSDRGSMPLLMLVMMIGVLMGGVILPVVVTQDNSTRFDSSRVAALGASESGIEVAVGQIRRAVAADGTGDSAKLPCGPFSGVAAGSGNGSYYTEILYYSVDPIAVTSSNNPMVCAPGYGPYDANTSPPTRTPRFACIVSTGRVDGTTTAITANTNSQCSTAAGAYRTGGVVTKGRTLVTTYVFTTDDTNFPGGVIRIFPSGTANFCMDAGSAAPAVNTNVTIQPCSTSYPPSAQQTWAYRSDLSIQLVSSASSTSAGLCLESAQPHAAGNPVYLALCNALGSASAKQQWSVDDNAHLRGANSSGTDVDGYCINVGGQAAGVALLVQGCAGGTTDYAQTWVPSPSTGPGMAGPVNKQLVNFQQFGTCLDVTGQNVSSTFLILYTCKQNPDPTKVAWNQKFTATPALAPDSSAKPTTVEWVTTYNGSNYCLQSPGNSLGGYVVVSLCPSTTPTAPSPYLWVTNRKLQSDGATPLSYNNRYTIKDSLGLCLGVGSNSDLLNGAYFKVVTATCNGSTGQKWNADPSAGKSALQNTHEN